MRTILLILSTLLAGCGPSNEPAVMRAEVPGRPVGSQVRTAAFVITEGVFNSELMAPYDIFHHSIFRDSTDYIEPFIVTRDGGPVTTFEGIRVAAHYSYDSAPNVDILVIPSTEGSMDRDLVDEAYLGFLRRAIAQADWVVTLCDGAFPLAQTGALDSRHATTFPADRRALAERFSAVTVHDDARFVVDGKFITSVGGGMSYEPALYLTERLYSPEFARETAEGLVWAWDLAAVPHFIAPQ
jgi:transcriptional regulator GlxA family with amidase domain